MTIEHGVLLLAQIDRATAKTARQPKGWASTYDNADRLGRIMKVGAFGSTLGGTVHGGKDFASFSVPLLAYHQDDKAVGASKMSPKPEYGMYHDSGLAETAFAKEVAALIDAGALPATSIGWDADSSVFTTNAKGQREYSFIDVMENSLCPCPANPLAVLEVASAGGAPPAWEAGVPAWIRDAWPDFARSLLPEREVIDLSRPVKEDAAGARHSQADQGYIQGAHDSLVKAGASCMPDKEEAAAEREVAAVWTTAYKNDLPDSAFALVLDGGTKDADGKTTPRSLRKLPYKNAEGKIDAPHVRNGLARLGQGKPTEATEEQRTAATTRLLAAAKSVGVDAKEAATILERSRASSVQGSFEELQDMLSDALRGAYPNRYPWIRATFADSVVYRVDGDGLDAPAGTYRVAYSVDPDDGDIEFGVPEEVLLREQVVTLPADTDDDRLVASVELEALEVEASSLAS